MRRDMRSPIPWFGGKGNMVKKLMPLVPPEHHTYCEPFGGGGSLLLAKPPSAVEVYNDVDGGLVNFFRVLADTEDFERFYRRVATLPYSRALYEEYRDSCLLVAEANRRRRKLTTGVCPVCQQKIQGSRFEKLGHWPGWATSITPDYWPALRLYVFERDSYTCQRCRKRLSDTSKLRAHHIHRKEDGGKDSAKNLTTLCADCHKDEHPIFPLGDELEAAIERMVDREF